MRFQKFPQVHHIQSSYRVSFRKNIEILRSFFSTKRSGENDHLQTQIDSLIQWADNILEDLSDEHPPFSSMIFPSPRAFWPSGFRKLVNTLFRFRNGYIYMYNMHPFLLRVANHIICGSLPILILTSWKLVSTHKDTHHLFVSTTSVTELPLLSVRFKIG